MEYVKFDLHADGSMTVQVPVAAFRQGATDQITSMVQTMSSQGPPSAQPRGPQHPLPSCTGGRELAGEALYPPGQPVKITTKSLTGKCQVYSMLPSSSIDTLKARIQDKEGIPPDQIRLVWGGKELEDSLTLRHYRIPSGATVHMILRCRGCVCGCSDYLHAVIKFKNGEVVDLDVGIGHTIASVKEDLEKKLQKKLPSLRLLHKGVALDSDKTFESLGVTGEEGKVKLEARL